MQLSKTVQLLISIHTRLPFHHSLARTVNPTQQRVKLATGDMMFSRHYVLPSHDVTATGLIALASVVEHANAHKTLMLTDCQLSSAN